MGPIKGGDHPLLQAILFTTPKRIRVVAAPFRRSALVQKVSSTYVVVGVPAPVFLRFYTPVVLLPYIAGRLLLAGKMVQQQAPPSIITVRSVISRADERYLVDDFALVKVLPTASCTLLAS